MVLNSTSKGELVAAKLKPIQRRMAFASATRRALRGFYQLLGHVIP